MALSINQSNYATPVGSYNNLYSADVTVQPYRFLALADNVLDGSCHPLGPEYVWWGNSLSDEAGLLSTPVEITISGLNEDIITVSLTGDAFENNYPVDFTISTYKDGVLLNRDTIVDNHIACITHQISAVHTIDTCVISITRISKANSVAKLVNVYHPYILVRSDDVSLSASSTGNMSEQFIKAAKDTVRVSVRGASHVTNDMRRLYREPITVNETTVPTNVHTRMKDTTRQIFGRVEITYTDPLVEGRVDISTSGTAHGSNVEHLSNLELHPANKVFSLYDNKLDGTYHCIDENSEAGWWSNVLSDENGDFDVPPYLSLTFQERPLLTVSLVGDSIRNLYPVDFDIIILRTSGTQTINVRDNNSISYEYNFNEVSDATGIRFVFHKVNKPYHPVVLVEAPVASTVVYESDRLISINMLEELAYEDAEEVLGGVCANELTVHLSNVDKMFYFNNPNSLVSKHLKKNRKIRAWLGTDIDGALEWYKLGTYWSYSWDVPIGSLTASVVAFDTLGLLNTMLFYNHQVFMYTSVGALIEYVLTDAKWQLSSLEWTIDPELYNITIPYFWFEYASHMAALKRISTAYPVHIFCDRDGKVVAKQQRTELTEYYDAWSENDTVIETTYPTLYTAMPNHVEVEVHRAIVASASVVSNIEPFDIADTPEMTITFNGTYVNNLELIVDCDDTVAYTYKAYSWGLVMNFAGTGTVHAINATANTITTEVSSIVTKKDMNSIALNGTIKRTVQSPFIQTPDRATFIAESFTNATKQDRYDAEVRYRGDIALSIDNPVKLMESIAPTNIYNIIKHELHWDGSLSGTATLNT